MKFSAAGEMSEIGRGLRHGAATSASVTAAYLGAIATYDRKLGAFLFVDDAGALAAAKALDAMRAAGTDLGPLMGLPVALKDHISVEGMPTRAGSDLDLNDITAPEGPLVRRLRRAGCVILGKTRATEFALGAINLRHPTPRNPWDATVARMPGGSSNGSAVATAAGLCAFAFGTDTGGSVRLPAALCGLVGYKPSADVFPLRGVFPLSPELDTLGTFTRSVRDAIVIHEALGGALVQHRTSVRGLRLAEPVGQFFDGLDAAVARAIERVIGALAASGAQITRVPFPVDFDTVDEIFAKLVPVDLIATIGLQRFLSQADLIDPIARERMRTALDVKAYEYARLRLARTDARNAAPQDGIDAWLTPTTPTLAIPIDECRTAADGAAWNRRSLRNTRPMNVLGQCAITIPVAGPDDALPIGLQLSAPSGDDAALLSLAAAVESTLGIHAPPDIRGFRRTAKPLPPSTSVITSR